ncbi:PREDICTED: putative phosphatidylglycerol/phosphatidylinositol transfer protein DDB_G0278295 [Amphimedon queenslandica]|uniref:MD-2-related lipid-recognition domain-containing protein n=1 Tax=Amphimedon queenslandica TaxID=400682 RepID=A0A1X7V3S4_AMPQE|nr:PREDICTED: putative phosphatidylglycerol/phosphatidylinositol transfer protein DDB_G0278295 [Amphimedon queenslandica]|eukprot:XP_011403235.1 PREDICTED: putative phosphatidylglycerol/phosphatidylinositol transfer protein DDB_G0278295 [Amphimedon queenslandica]
MMIFLLALVAAASSLISASPVYLEKGKNYLNNTNSIWTDCSKSSDPLVIYSINVSPVTLQRGQPIYISVVGYLKEPINDGGTVSVVLRYANAMNILRKKYDFCTFIEAAQLSCPLEDGSISMNYSEEIPSSAPPGQYKGSIVAYSDNGDEITCVTIQLTISA